MAAPVDLSAETIASSVPVLIEGVELEEMSDGGICRLRSAAIERKQPFRWLAKVFRLPNHISVELDDIGSWVVKRLGQCTLREVASDLATEWNLTKREAEASVTVFIRALLRRRLVRLEWAQDNS